MDFTACSVDGCASNAHRSANGAAGLCCAHYKRKRKTGDPLGSQRKPGPAISWLADHVGYESDECLAWPFSRNPQGYGLVRVNQKTLLAHRYMCLLSNGSPSSEGMDAAHSCGKGHEGCVNPAHLRWDTRSGNFSDKLAHGTDNRGEKSPVSKLTESDVIKIREMRGTVSQSQLAKMFNIDQSNVSKIQSGHSWSWL